MRKTKTRKSLEPTRVDYCWDIHTTKCILCDETNIYEYKARRLGTEDPHRLVLASESPDLLQRSRSDMTDRASGQSVHSWSLVYDAENNDNFGSGRYICQDCVDKLFAIFKDRIKQMFRDMVD